MHKKKIGILGGTFDPIHFGHINLALSLKETCRLEEVLFVPAKVSPFKLTAPPMATSEQRCEMLKLAIAPIRGFRVVEYEIETEGPSYTIDTIRKIIADPTIEPHLLVGEDHLSSFRSWKESEELIKLAPPLIGARGIAFKGGTDPELLALSNLKINIPLFDISSTAVRERLLQKKYCGHLVPQVVLDYIARHRLYVET